MPVPSVATSIAKDNDSNTLANWPLANKPVASHCHNPALVLASSKVARTLTISDQHANILLTINKSEEKALLKLTLVPFHKKELARLPPRAPTITDDDNKDLDLLSEIELASRMKAESEQEEKEHSAKVLTFLTKFDWRMTSESGAEYSYHEAFPKTQAVPPQDKEVKEPAFKRVKTEEMGAVESPAAVKLSVFKAELIFPASERQVSRAMPSPGMTMIYETPSLYQTVTKPYIDRLVASGSLSWLKNIVEVKKEKERLLHDAEGWILNVDTKWRTHPDALTIPRTKWYQHESIVDLYCLGIFKAEGVASLRDLNQEHLPLLRELLETGPKVIEDIYGVTKNQLRIYVHYQPQFYHFHVHFTRLENDTGAQVEKAHLLSDIIQNLEQNGDYFKAKTMVYKLSPASELAKLLLAAPGSGENSGVWAWTESTLDTHKNTKKVRTLLAFSNHWT
jgi:m7GpppX diphosphatase